MTDGRPTSGGDLLAQARGQRFVERGERLVEDQEIRLDREGASQRHAAGEAERNSPGKCAAMRGQVREHRTARRALRRRPRGAASRTFSSTERHGNSRGSWNTMPSRACGGRATRPVEIVVEPGDDAQHRGLAAAGRADEARRPRPLQREADAAQHLDALARGGLERLLPRDSHLKRHGAASGMRVFQTAAPERSRSTSTTAAKRQRIGENTCHVEQLEGNADLEPDAVRPSRAVRPPARSSRPATGRSGRRPRDRAQAAAARHGGTRFQRGIANTRAISSRRGSSARAPSRKRDDGGRQLVDGDRRDRRGLGQPGPDIGEHDHDQRRQIEQHDQPGVAEPVGQPRHGPSR